VKIDVECSAGWQGEEMPQQIRFGGRVIAVIDVIDRWPASDHRYVKVRAQDGATYILRHDVDLGLWELIMFDSGGGPLPSPLTSSVDLRQGRKPNRQGKRHFLMLSTPTDKG
jgi:hypothetical protein